MKQKLSPILLLLLALSFLPTSLVRAEDLSSRLSGKILLQVEDKGQAWYINPDNKKRYYLGRPADAFQVMRNLGLGVSNKDFASFNGRAPRRLSGKILLKVEDSGKAYYANPTDLKLHFLGKPADAFQIMRELGMGISNRDLASILENGQITPTSLTPLNNAEIIKQLEPAVVYIETDNGSGSGFIIESTGYVLTNAHVVEGVASATILLSDGTSLNATVVGRDENLDLALLKASKTGLKSASLGDSDTAKQGDEVFTLGFPFGIKGEVSFKEGTISRRLETPTISYFETSAEIHPGNSGGPLVNKYGQVVGINTAVVGQSIAGVTLGETIKLAIPINVAKGILNDLKNGRSILNPKVSVVTKPEPAPQTCTGSLHDLQEIGSSHYSMYHLYGAYDTDIFIESNEVKLTGTIKNSSSCYAYNIKIKVIISDSNNPALVQEETLVLKKNTLGGNTLSLTSGTTGEYKAIITAFDAFVKTTTSLGTVTDKQMKDTVKVQTQIVSADWLPTE